jgi:diadenosine tetraphosphate (Ap4A) HIT family hydrolase
VSVEQSDCPFCALLESDIVTIRAPAVAAFPDAYPVSPGHTLVVPTRHVSDFFDLSADEQSAVWRLVADVRHRLAAEHGAVAFNVGLNAADAAGQTVPHAHVHVIPRYVGDVPDPRGGVRCVIPDRAAWWEQA